MIFALPNRKLIGLCQRDNTNYYDHIEDQEDSIVQDVVSFYREHIEDRFPSPSFVFDVIRSKKDKVILVDFNPYGETTDPLFFTWDELEQGFDFDFRYATDSSGVQPHPYRHYSVPRDFVDLSTGADPAKLIDFLKLQSQQQDSDSDD